MSTIVFLGILSVLAALTAGYAVGYWRGRVENEDPDLEEATKLRAQALANLEQSEKTIGELEDTKKKYAAAILAAQQAYHIYAHYGEESPPEEKPVLQ